ncbi:glycosyltransferase family 4 protein [Undibacterium sp. SXout20W]|uniref:glycosyltransferase family 4 protein n=1 Tax=Undibacterium sp. SXout20W TaxID=3413051 RepID=UPI003BF244E9
MLGLDAIIFSLQKNGGITVYFRELINYLISQDVETTLFCENQVGERAEFGAPVSLHSQQHRTLERYRSCLINDDISVFHSSYYRKPSLSVPTVVTVHDFVYERYASGAKKWVHSMQKNAAIRSAQAIICISQATKDDLLEFVGEAPGQEIYVVHNGVSDHFHVLDQKNIPKPFILFVGQRAGYKNFQLVLQTMSFLPDMELRCVGGGAFEAAEFDGITSDVKNRVRHMGFVDDVALNLLYNQAVCLVYPSKYEGFGIPVVEAMRAGCPVVSIDCKAVTEVGKDALLLVPESDPKLVSEAVNSTRSAERAAFIARGLAVAQNYSWDKTHQQTLAIYRSLS